MKHLSSKWKEYIANESLLITLILLGIGDVPVELVAAPRADADSGADSGAEAGAEAGANTAAEDEQDDPEERFDPGAKTEASTIIAVTQGYCCFHPGI